MDLSKLSDSDLQQIAKGDLRMMSEEGLKLIASSGSAPSAKKIGASGFGDALRETLQDSSWTDRNLAGFGTAASDLYQGAKQFVGMGDKQAIDANNIIKQEAPVGAIAGNVAATAIPFGLAGNSLKAAGMVGAGLGALSPVSGEQTLGNIAKGKAMNAAFGAGAGVIGQGVANKLSSGLSNKISTIEQSVTDKAAQVAASETASARSAAGTAAQNAYKQLEHLRELGANRALTAEEQLTVLSLERELAEKALDKLMPAAAFKQSTSEAYKDAMKTEAERAAKYAAEKLSSKEAKQQFMARAKRYGPAVIGGALGHMALPGVGTLGGIAGGLYLRPAIRSMINLSKNPAVQHGLLSAVEDSRFISPGIPATSFLLGKGLLSE